MRLTRVWAFALMALSLLAGSLSSTPDEARASDLCTATGSPEGPFAFETYEAADYQYSYARAMELAGLNQLFPEYGYFALPPLESGDRTLGSSQTVEPYIPPVLLKAIAWIESGWAQASYDPLVQYGEVGPTLVSHDCGYGIMQITSGMQNVNGVPNMEQAMIGGHYAFNIARGARILAEKWNWAPESRPLVGNRDPHIVENWYYALWGYNGFTRSNHPQNYSSNRGLYDCVSARSGYPYQELVLGCVANPPTRGGVRLWDPVEVHLPVLWDPDFQLFDLCAGDEDCAGMDIPTPNPNHTDPAAPGIPRQDVLGSTQFAISQGLITMNPPGGQAQIVVSNPTDGILSWKGRTTASWLTISRLQGVAIPGRNSTFVVTADTSALGPGTHTAQVILETLWPSASARAIQVEVGTACQPTGGVDAVDALQVLRHVAGLSACLADIGDADCSGQVNTIDALVVLRYVAGLPTSVPQDCPPLT